MWQEQGEEVTQTEAFPLSTEDCSENAHFYETNRKYKMYVRLEET